MVLVPYPAHVVPDYRFLFQPAPLKYLSRSAADAFSTDSGGDISAALEKARRSAVSYGGLVEAAVNGGGVRDEIGEEEI